MYPGVFFPKFETISGAPRSAILALPCLGACMASSGAVAPTCIVCLEDLDAANRLAARTCGFCGRHICETCMGQLTEINYDGEADVENGDLRCPNCRGSLIDGDLHQRRRTIRCFVAAAVSDAVVDDVVTLEDLTVRLMQLCACAEADVNYYNADRGVVAAAIARDRQYCAMLDRAFGSAREARSFRHAVRTRPTDKDNVTKACRMLLTLLTQKLGVEEKHARRILEEVAYQGLRNEADLPRYQAVWQKPAAAGDDGPLDRLLVVPAEAPASKGTSAKPKRARAAGISVAVPTSSKRTRSSQPLL